MKQEVFPFGATVKERISDFEGVVVGDILYLNGCVAYQVKKRGVNSEGLPFEATPIEAGMLLPRPDYELVMFDPAPEHFPLGGLVKDRYSGFEGVAYASARWAFGQRRVGILPRAKKDKEPVKMSWFDDADVVAVGDEEVSWPTPATGGDRRHDKP